MKLFDSNHPLVRAYLHLSYALSVVLLSLLSKEFVDMLFGKTPASDLLSKEFLASLAIGTLLVAGMLYLHLPKMINRCFTIGRHFGL
jgi:hypothetical protein